MPREAPIRRGNGARSSEYATRSGYERGTLRTVLRDSLVEYTGDQNARMCWTPAGFRDKVFMRYGVKLVGWPSNIDFANPSDRSMRTENIRTLLEAFGNGRLRWAKTTLGERLAADWNAWHACPGTTYREPLPKGVRNDIGKRKERPTVDSERFPPRRMRNGPKSMRYISADVDALADALVATEKAEAAREAAEKEAAEREAAEREVESEIEDPDDWRCLDGCGSTGHLYC